MRLEPPFRAEHVGSLLRPRRLKEAAVAHAKGSMPADEYERILTEEIAKAVAVQEGVGLRSITDGEFGRTSWFGFFFERLEGFSIQPSRFAFKDAEGHRHEWSTCYADAPMRRTRPIAGEEFDRLRALTSRTPKANLPTPSALHFFRGDDCRDPEVYPDIDRWWDELIGIYRAEIADLAGRGCTYLQLDEVPIAMLCDPDIRAQVGAQGADPDGLLATYLERVDQALEARPDSMVVGMHLCRGNFRSRWMASGGYEPVAERLFNNVGVDAYFLEYDSERAGDFSPLRFVPPEKVVVLGLVSSKSPQLENPDDLLRRIDEAAAFVPVDQLAVSPQCGFASVAGGNTLDDETERRKLELVVDVAQRVWGTP